MTEAAAMRDHAPKIHGFLAAAILIAVVALTFTLFLKLMPEGNRDPFLLILGALLARLGDVYAYYFGSTSESRVKTDALASVASSQVTPSPGTAVTVSAADVTATTTVTDAGPADDELPADQRVLP